MPVPAYAPAVRFDSLRLDGIALHTIMQGMINIEPLQIAQRAVEIASDKQASNIILLDIRAIADFADYFVLLSADNSRQINALVEDITLSLKGEGVTVSHREGTMQSGWVLLDYGDVVIHVFSPEERQYYRLEELWRQAVPLIHVQ